MTPARNDSEKAVERLLACRLPLRDARGAKPAQRLP